MYFDLYTSTLPCSLDAGEILQKFNKMQQHPPGRQVGGRIYYGAYHGREVQCKKCLLVTFTILLLLIGFIVTLVGHTLKPFWSDTSFCSFCEEDNRIRRRNAANCRIVGPILITLGILVLIFTIYYFKKKKAEGLTGGGNTSYGEPAQTKLTYNQTSQSVNVPYPGTGQMQPSGPQPPYNTTHPGGSQPYPTVTAPQPYPTGLQPYSESQQYPAFQSGTPYPPAQQPYPGTAQDNILPPPSYSDAVSGSGGLGEKN